MKIQKFEDIQSWQKARTLSFKVYTLFEGNNDFGFRDQIRRAAVSVMNNIAEGFERSSGKEFKYFLYVAKGSCGEVRSMLHLAHDLKYIDQTQFDELSGDSKEISRMISGFIKTL